MSRVGVVVKHPIVCGDAGWYTGWQLSGVTAEPFISRSLSGNGERLTPPRPEQRKLEQVRTFLASSPVLRTSTCKWILYTPSPPSVHLTAFMPAATSCSPPSHAPRPCYPSAPPYQSAFAYTAVVPDTELLGNEERGDAGNGGKAGNAAKMVTVRRLRVSTVRTDSSPSVEVVAKAADPATVAAVLAHKVVSEARRR